MSGSERFWLAVVVVVVLVFVFVLVVSPFSVLYAVGQASSVEFQEGAYLSEGFHDLDELVDLGIANNRLRWSSAFFSRFIFRGCGFALSYGMAADTPEVVHLYVDGSEASAFDNVGGDWGPHVVLVATDCGVHRVLIGSRVVETFWFLSVDVWGPDYAP